MLFKHLSPLLPTAVFKSYDQVLFDEIDCNASDNETDDNDDLEFYEKRYNNITNIYKGFCQECVNGGRSVQKGWGSEKTDSEF